MTVTELYKAFIVMHVDVI